MQPDAQRMRLWRLWPAPGSGSSDAGAADDSSDSFAVPTQGRAAAAAPTATASSSAALNAAPAGIVEAAGAWPNRQRLLHLLPLHVQAHSPAAPAAFSSMRVSAPATHAAPVPPHGSAPTAASAPAAAAGGSDLLLDVSAVSAASDEDDGYVAAVLPGQHSLLAPAIARGAAAASSSSQARKTTRLEGADAALDHHNISADSAATQDDSILGSLSAAADEMWTARARARAWAAWKRTFALMRTGAALQARLERAAMIKSWAVMRSVYAAGAAAAQSAAERADAKRAAAALAAWRDAAALRKERRAVAAAAVAARVRRSLLSQVIGHWCARTADAVAWRKRCRGVVKAIEGKRMRAALAVWRAATAANAVPRRFGAELRAARAAEAISNAWLTWRVAADRRALIRRVLTRGVVAQGAALAAHAAAHSPAGRVAACLDALQAWRQALADRQAEQRRFAAGAMARQNALLRGLSRWRAFAAPRAAAHAAGAALVRQLRERSARSVLQVWHALAAARRARAAAFAARWRVQAPLRRAFDVWIVALGLVRRARRAVLRRSWLHWRRCTAGIAAAVADADAFARRRALRGCLSVWRAARSQAEYRRDALAFATRQRSRRAAAAAFGAWRALALARAAETAAAAAAREAAAQALAVRVQYERDLARARVAAELGLELVADDYADATAQNGCDTAAGSADGSIAAAASNTTAADAPKSGLAATSMLTAAHSPAAPAAAVPASEASAAAVATLVAPMRPFDNEADRNGGGASSRTTSSSGSPEPAALLAPLPASTGSSPASTGAGLGLADHNHRQSPYRGSPAQQYSAASAEAVAAALASARTGTSRSPVTAASTLTSPAASGVMPLSFGSRLGLSSVSGATASSPPGTAATPVGLQRYHPQLATGNISLAAVTPPHPPTGPQRYEPTLVAGNVSLAAVSPVPVPVELQLQSTVRPTTVAAFADFSGADVNVDADVAAILAQFAATAASVAHAGVQTSRTPPSDLHLAQLQLPSPPQQRLERHEEYTRDAAAQTSLLIGGVAAAQPVTSKSAPAASPLPASPAREAIGGLLPRASPSAAAAGLGGSPRLLSARTPGGGRAGALAGLAAAHAAVAAAVNTSHSTAVSGSGLGSGSGASATSGAPTWVPGSAVQSAAASVLGGSGHSHGSEAEGRSSVSPASSAVSTASASVDSPPELASAAAAARESAVIGSSMHALSPLGARTHDGPLPATSHSRRKDPMSLLTSPLLPLGASTAGTPGPDAATSVGTESMGSSSSGVGGGGRSRGSRRNRDWGAELSALVFSPEATAHGAAADTAASPQLPMASSPRADGAATLTLPSRSLAASGTGHELLPLPLASSYTYSAATLGGSRIGVDRLSAVASPLAASSAGSGALGFDSLRRIGDAVDSEAQGRLDWRELLSPPAAPATASTPSSVTSSSGSESERVGAAAAAAGVRAAAPRSSDAAVPSVAHAASPLRADASAAAAAASTAAQGGEPSLRGRLASSIVRSMLKAPKTWSHAAGTVDAAASAYATGAGTEAAAASAAPAGVVAPVIVPTAPVPSRQIVADGGIGVGLRDFAAVGRAGRAGLQLSDTGDATAAPAGAAASTALLQAAAAAARRGSTAGSSSSSGSDGSLLDVTELRGMMSQTQSVVTRVMARGAPAAAAAEPHHLDAVRGAPSPLLPLGFAFVDGGVMLPRP